LARLIFSVLAIYPSAVICSFPGGGSGGCNPRAHVESYFRGIFEGGEIISHFSQYGAFSGTKTLYGGQTGPYKDCSNFWGCGDPWTPWINFTDGYFVHDPYTTKSVIRFRFQSTAKWTEGPTVFPGCAEWNIRLESNHPIKVHRQFGENAQVVNEGKVIKIQATTYANQAGTVIVSLRRPPRTCDYSYTEHWWDNWWTFPVPNCPWNSDSLLTAQLKSIISASSCGGREPKISNKTVVLDSYLADANWTRFFNEPLSPDYRIFGRANNHEGFLVGLPWSWNR